MPCARLQAATSWATRMRSASKSMRRPSSASIRSRSAQSAYGGVMTRRDRPAGTKSSGGRRLEGQGDAVDAVAQAGRLRAVIEDVAQMAAAARAMDGRAHHEEGGVLGRANGVLQRRPEAG